MTWETIKRIRDITKMEILIKGIMNPEDATMCVKLGNGIYVRRGMDIVKALAMGATMPAPLRRIPVFLGGPAFLGG